MPDRRPTSPIRRVLVANRGEIAVRIIRAAEDLGIETVAVYSKPDAESSHVRRASQALCIGPAPAARSYLRPELLLHAATVTGCDAVHPGYGFLSEDAGFARQVSDAGLVWIGPPAEVIARMGDKAAARTAALEAEVPVVPGSEGVLPSSTDALAFAQSAGFPLLLKARAGGGGKGMRVVGGAADLPAAFALASQEAAGAFGDGGLYAERYLPRVRHIEIQIMADQHGGVRHLGERDCSLQRRHQKVVEEAPSPAVPPGLRARIGDAAVSLAASVGYVGAGTIEFLLDPNAEAFYFIEMNTRIQVEHALTEQITGVDLVAWQFRVAQGEPLSLDDVSPRGHALEFRITAEDWRRDFMPSPGTLRVFELPAGPGVRVDTHCRPGFTVTPYYDSLLAKLIVHGSDRPEALRRAKRALGEFRIEGVTTTLPLHRALLSEPAVLAGDYSTQWLEDWVSSADLKEETES
ncbi:MAG: acetyl-CoA carboxylase biotin carboxylase subunit [Mycobacteriales bacterium]